MIETECTREAWIEIRRRDVPCLRRWSVAGDLDKDEAHAHVLSKGGNGYKVHLEND